MESVQISFVTYLQTNLIHRMDRKAPSQGADSWPIEERQGQQSTNKWQGNSQKKKKVKNSPTYKKRRGFTELYFIYMQNETRMLHNSDSLLKKQMLFK